MTTIEHADRDYWNDRYSRGYTSGAGSYGGAMLRKVKWLAKLQGIKSVTELGCGDYHFGRHLMDRLPDATYIGLDTSDEIVTRNKRLYELPRIQFDYINDETKSERLRSDLLLCVDVLFHITADKDYEMILKFLGTFWTKYLALSAYEYDGLRQGHIAIRKFNPEFFGKPILREVIEEDGQMYFYIFEK